MLLPKSLNRASVIKILFLVIVVITSLFVSNENIRYLPYINLPKFIIYIPLFFICIAFLVFNKRFYLDLISIFLFTRLTLYIIPLVYSGNTEGYWGNYLAVIASFVAYFVASQVHNNSNKKFANIINKLLACFLIIGSLQAIYLFLILSFRVGYTSINILKLNMVTPIGGSNYIATLLLPLIVFVYNSKINRILKTSSILLGLVSLLLIQSKNAILVIIIFMAIKFVKSFIYMLIREKKSNSHIRIAMIIITTFLSIMIFSVALLLIRYFVNKWNMGMISNNDSIYDVLNGLTSGRLTVYSNEINRWTDHLLFGNGLGYEPGYLRSHNWIIEVLVQSGFFGFIVFICLLFFWFFKVFRMKDSNVLIKSSYYSIIVILIQGLAEVSVFTVSVDILLWYLVGITIAELNYLKNDEKRNYRVEGSNG